MIGIGVSPSLSAQLGDVTVEASTALMIYEGRPITLEVVAVLVRYRLARRSGITPAPCSNGDTVCIAS